MRPETLNPGATIGILGGGQLGRLLAVAAAKLGFHVAIYAPEEGSPAFQVAMRHWLAAYDDEQALAAFAKECDVVTFEFENVPARALEIAQRHTPVRPPARAAQITQDRITEKSFLHAEGLPVAPHIFILGKDDLKAASAFLEGHERAILKTAREGYDGKGQKRVSSPCELEAAFSEIPGRCVLEAVVDFDMEISVIAVRTIDGKVFCYDCPQNRHSEGILRTSSVPAKCSDEVSAIAQQAAARIASGLDYCGVLGVEFFVSIEACKECVIVNEIAPRVHNSGHWTMDACTVSQFENHIRAVAGWPIGSVERHSDAVMTNLIGDDVLRWREILENDTASSIYLYGKEGVREGRKLGHVTRISPRTKK